MIKAVGWEILPPKVTHKCGATFTIKEYLKMRRKGTCNKCGEITQKPISHTMIQIGQLFGLIPYEGE